ncbi:amidohydrolase family protein [Iamia majanohamensis]|uniref:Amidohydrolase family protein n=1 Tax=Iamia majanohamensis TaxID=467976 RepID=A0AAE9YE06_9ACTN|nr:amidohydrolase family protein [Iamia majanohamensis]WCO66116.1 amidohydrolase family protein [Iamia majanohamensis]
MPRDVLRGARLVDGTGGPERSADVVVADGRIEAVTAPGTADGDVVDLDGLVLAPGFIDPHTHYDAQLLWDAGLTPSSWHGVTTVVTGNCGFGIAPTRPKDRPTVMRVLENVEGMPLDALEQGIDWGFETFPEYLDAVEARPLRLNVAALLGHTPLRYWVMGDDATEREATDDEVAAMAALVDEGMEVGAVGVSTSRSPSHVGAYGRPVPSRAATVAELTAILEPLRARGAGYVEATWGPDFHVDEAAALARHLDRPVSWAAIMANHREPGVAVATAERVVAAGGPVFPQIACRPIVVQIQLSDPSPFATAPAFAEVLGRERADRAALYAEEGWRRRAAADLEATWGPLLERGQVAESARHAELVDGPTLGELAAASGRTALAVMADLALEEDLTTRFRVAVVNDDDDQIAELLAYPDLLLGLSDAGAHTSQLCDANYATWLLGHWWRDRGTLTLEQAVWRLTGHPAQVVGLTGRGRVEAGWHADLVAFDPDTVGTGPAQRVTDFPGGCDRLVAPSTGIVHTWVGGERTWSDGAEVAGAGSGRLLRHGR